MSESRTRALVLHIEFKSRAVTPDRASAPLRSAQARLEEVTGLTLAVGVEVVESLLTRPLKS